MGEGHEKVANPEEIAELRRTGRQIMTWSLLTSGAMTAMAVAAVALR